MDLLISSALTIPSAELGWRFSRSSGPGGQHVNTSDSRVELIWDVVGSTVLSDEQRATLLMRLGRRLIDGTIVVSASERRSQLRNREMALNRLAEIVTTALLPDATPRRPTRPTRGSVRRRLADKEQRSETKQQRKRPPTDS
jgi:ribosome-associated protein